MASAALGLIGAGSSLIGGFMGAHAASEAEKLLGLGKVNASALNWLLYNQSRRDQAPYANAGANSVNYLQYLLGIGGGPNGQVANAGGVDSGKQLYSGTISGMGSDGRPVKVTAAGQGSFRMTPSSGNDRYYQFLYNDGQNDVYQRTGGGAGSKQNIDYAIVGKDGKIQWAANPPVAGQFGNQGGGIPAGAENDPNFGSLMRDFGANDFQQDPGYQFRLAEGSKALQRSAAAKGGLFSGGTLKDLTNYNQNAASNEYANAYNRFQTNRATKYNQLAQLAGLGQVSANQITNQTGQLAGNLGQYTMQGAADAANARSSGYSAMANGITGAANSLMNWYTLSKMGGGGAGAGGGMI